MSTGSVPFIFGALEAVALPGTILTALLVDTGLSEAAARTLLARLKARGEVSVTRVGRVGVYRLAGRMLERFQRVERGPRPESWDGRFRTVVFDIPESERAVKDKLRSLAAAREFGIVRPGVLISTQGDMLTGALLNYRGPGLLETGMLEFAPAVARDVAATAWNLQRRAEEFADACRRAEGFTDPAAVPADPRQAFRSFHDMYLASIDVRMHDPGLPAELLPPEWEAGRLNDLLITMLVVWDDALSAHIDARLQASRHRRLVELRPQSDDRWRQQRR